MNYEVKIHMNDKMFRGRNTWVVQATSSDGKRVRYAGENLDEILLTISKEITEREFYERGK